MVALEETHLCRTAALRLETRRKKVSDITSPRHTSRGSTAIIMEELTQRVQRLIEELG